jgi:hypothetical protein
VKATSHIRLRLSVIILTVALSTAISPTHSSGCVRGFAEHKVGSSFLVRVSYEGQPLRGIETEISRETPKEPYFTVVASTKTNENGESEIKSLDPGNYFLVVKHAGIDGEAVDLKVVDKQQPDTLVEDRLNLSWPYRNVLKVRQVAGTLVQTPFDSTVRSIEPPLANAKITLIDAIPATQHSVSVVQKNGRFAFKNLNPGLYILHIKQDKDSKQASDFEEKIEGDIFVEIVPNAAERKIPLLRLYMSDCGMGGRGKDGKEAF